MSQGRPRCSLGNVSFCLSIAETQHAAFAGPTAAASTPTQIAKAAPAPPAKAPTRAVAQVSNLRPLKLAQLNYPVSADASADELLQVADDCSDHCNWPAYGKALQQVLNSHPGTSQAGLRSSCWRTWTACAATKQRPRGRSPNSTPTLTPRSRPTPPSFMPPTL